MGIKTFGLSGNVNRDAVMSGVAWDSNSLTYGFPTEAAQFDGYGPTQEPFDNFAGLTPVQQAVVRTVLGMLSSITNLVFSEITGSAAGTALLRFGQTDDTTAAHGYYPSNTPKGGDTWYRNSGTSFDNPAIGNYAFLGFMHEIGHAVGLMHPHESTPPPTVDGDWMGVTVMSYRSSAGGGLGYTNEAWGFAQSYMMLDIAALQYMYGANFNYNSGDTVYRWDPLTGEMVINGVGQGVPGSNRIFLTVWDGGGTDTYDFSNYNVASTTIDLRPGAWSLFSTAQHARLTSGGNHPPGNVANAYLFEDDPRSLIENAIGTSGNDTITGNSANNNLRGMAGNDIINGGDGNDTLIAGSGEDTLNGDAGNDILYFGANLTSGDAANGGADKDIVVLQGNYTLTLGAAILTGSEYLSLQSGSVTRWGDLAGNLYSYNLTMHEANAAAGQQLVVNAQSLLLGENFTFNGSAETDGRYLVYGGRGFDNLTGGSGNDLFSFEGARWGPTDVITGGAGTDAVLLSMGHGLNHIVFGENQFTGIESISVNNRFASDPSQVPSYELVIRNGNVTPGGSLIVNGSSLPAAQTIAIDGSQVIGGQLRMFGGAGDDAFIGGALGDLIYGRGGADISTGGAGADVFEYRDASDSTLAAPDRILDFAPGTDKLDLHFIDAVAGGADDAFSFIGSGAFTGVAGQLRSEFDAGAGVWRVEGDIDGIGGADFVILVSGSLANPLTTADFVL